ncbi:MAG: hypothetical protein RL885_05410 [Planctomycetota bacterium]
MLRPGLLICLLLTPLSYGLTGPHQLEGARQRSFLRGPWSCALDPEGKGEAEKWYSPEKIEAFEGRISLPAWWGDKGTPMDRGYEGVAWLAKSFKVPVNSEGRRSVLRCQGIWRRARFWLNGQPIGESRLPGLPFELDLEKSLKVGDENWLVVAVDSRPRPGDFRVPVEDALYTWGGIPSPMIIEHRSAIAEVESVRARPAGDGQVEIEAEIRRFKAGEDLSVRLHLRRELSELRSTLDVPLELEGPGSVHVRGTLEMREPTAWLGSEPIFQVASAEIVKGETVLDELSQRCLPRTLSADERYVRLDDQRIYLRSGTDSGIFLGQSPPSFDPGDNRGVFGAMDRVAFNMVHCLGFVPPMEYLDAAGALGLLAWIELPIPNGDVLLENPDVEAYLREAIALAEAYPAVFGVTICQEAPAKGPAAEKLRKLLAEARGATRHCFIFGCPSWGPAEDPDVPLVFRDLPLGARLSEITPALAPPDEPVDRPVLVRNVGGYPTLPDVFYQRGALRREPSAIPSWLVSVKESVTAQDPDFQRNERLAAASDRTRGACLYREFDALVQQDWIGGIEIQTFTDAPLPLDHPLSHVGIANWFAWPKGGTTIRFLQPRIGDKKGSLGLDRFSYYEFDPLVIRPMVTNTLREPIQFDGYSISLLENKNLIVDERGPSIDLQPFERVTPDPIEWRAPSVGWTTQVEVRALFAQGLARDDSLSMKEGIWIVPKKRLAPQLRKIERSGATEVLAEHYPFIQEIGDAIPNVLVTTEINGLMFEVLAQPDGRVLLLGGGGRIPMVPSNWEPTVGRQLGTWVDNEHVFFSTYFPVEPFVDIWGYEVVNDGENYVLSDLPVRPKYLMRGVHAGTELWSPMFEIKVGPGRLLACSLDVLGHLDDVPTAGGLMDRLLHYVASDEIRPQALIMQQSFQKWLESR